MARSQHPKPSRRLILGSTLSLGLLACAPKADDQATAKSLAPKVFETSGYEDELTVLESRYNGLVGLSCYVPRYEAWLGHRFDERFAYCSVFKWILSAACLKGVDEGRLSLSQIIKFGPNDILEPAPVTRAALKDGQLSLEALCAGTVITSDNTAANLLMPYVGGLKGLSDFVKSYKDEVTRFDQIEPFLNENLKNDPRDTSSPKAMTGLLAKVVEGPGLTSESKAKLSQWLKDCETGTKRIRAGLPKDWPVGDKTGTSGNGAANDVAFFDTPQWGRIYLSVFTNRSEFNMDKSAAFIAEATRIVIDRLRPLESP